VKILSWNVLHGAGSRANRVIDALEAHAPDVVTLQEFRNNKAAPQIIGALNELGLDQVHVPPTDSARENTILVASCFEFEASTIRPKRSASDDGQVRCVQADFSPSGRDFTMIACHLPQKKAQLPYFEALLDLPAEYLSEPGLICGDLNCGIPFEDSQTKTFYATRLFQQMLKNGWIDTWRSRHPEAREFTWISTRNKNGFRYDQALATPSLDARIRAVEYDHGLRESGASDHSAMLVEIDE